MAQLTLLKHLWTKGFDGASVMVGRHNGVAARFKQLQTLLAFSLYLFLLLKMHTVDIQNSNDASSKCMPKCSYK
jgi:hypothetical protein